MYYYYDMTFSKVNARARGGIENEIDVWQTDAHHDDSRGRKVRGSMTYSSTIAFVAK